MVFYTFLVLDVPILFFGQVLLYFYFWFKYYKILHTKKTLSNQKVLNIFGWTK